ncbi:MAG: phosphoenolpyruvate carboxykinase (ATP) [Planctomycetaceae bacterium]|jgi:phosphoenolpyruvate carboxykinase (ATP)|nr:phosphoenolpyruvate carboxykinase (ATP) [Planctomycetaceae bacterium]
MCSELDLSSYGIHVAQVLRNASPARLYEEAVSREQAVLASTGALINYSGEKTGRSPKDKRVAKSQPSDADIWWGSVNIPMTPDDFDENKARAIDYLNTRDLIYIVDGYAGWEPKYRLKIRVVCCRAYHALFMYNMLIRPTAAELLDFGTPDFVIYNAGQFPANPLQESVGSKTCVALSFEKGELVILGTQYAGEMKKGVFTILNYLMPKKSMVSMHCSANEGKDGDVSLFFGLSGTGKTTLSTEPHRRLIGDDEHFWTNEGIVNIEGGCYAKCINLAPESEPEIFNAIRFGTVLENVVYNDQTRIVDFADDSITENTRASYPIEFIDNIKMPCVGGHPKNIVFLSCDAFGVLPPVSELTPEQAMYHFISGYTAKVAGTEVGVTEPEATFSACFGAAFLVWHPAKYAELLAANMKKYGSKAWLVNTGWSGGKYGVGKRLSIRHTRAIIDGIHSGELAQQKKETDPIFGLAIPMSCTDVPNEILNPRNVWKNKTEYDQLAMYLAGLFRKNFAKYEADSSTDIINAGPLKFSE